jgi:hypothetical protein
LGTSFYNYYKDMISSGRPSSTNQQGFAYQGQAKASKDFKVVTGGSSPRVHTVPKGYQGSQVYTVSHSAEPLVGATIGPNQQLYHVNFKVFYQTIPGESICVLGSIPELGSWKELKCHLKWTEGHIW